MVLLWMWACQPEAEFVTLSGTVFSEVGDEGIAVGGAELHTLALTGEVVDRVTADENGFFEAQIPSGAVFFVGVEASGYVSTGFSGQSATTDYPVSDGLIWMRSEESMAVIQSDFDGCDANDEDGATVEGWVGLGLDNGEGLESYVVTTAWVTAYDADANPYETCYLADDDEPQLDPEADLTGQHGRFLIQGSPNGLMTLEAGYWIDQSQDWAMDSVYYVIYVPEGGVAPFYPLWVPATAR